MDWHFWRDGQQVAVYSRLLDGKERYALYDAASALLIEELAGPSDGSLLPEWAKDNFQVQMKDGSMKELKRSQKLRKSDYHLQFSECH